jgi:hypothetical protein
MASNATHFRPRRSFLLLLIAILATAAQVTLALAPLAEGREARMVSHVEAGGVAGHFSHDDAKCVACQARLLHGADARPEPPLIVARLYPTHLNGGVERHDLDDRGRQDNPRAPPTLQA